MKKANFLITVFVSFATYSIAQEAPKPVSSCERNFNMVQQKVQDNYAGWQATIGTKTNKKFDAFTDKIKNKSSNITDPRECYFVIKEWLDYFDDEHLFLNLLNPYTSQNDSLELAGKIQSRERVSFKNEEEFVAALKGQSNLDQIVGVYETDDNTYKIGITTGSEPGSYKGFILEAPDNSLWKEGMVKFTMQSIGDDKFDGQFFYSNFSEERAFIKKIKNYIVLENIFKLKKVFPEPTEVVNNDDIVRKLPTYRIEPLSKNTLLFVPPPFTYIDAADIIVDMVNNNRDLLANTPNLIVDLRNNPGGDDNALVPLYPYVADKPIVRKGGLFRNSKENLLLLSQELESVQSYPKYKRLLGPKLQTIINDMRNSKDDVVVGPDKVFQYAKPFAKPSKVVVLINQKTASSAERIVMELQQSGKTIVMGEKSKGLTDYIEVRDWGLPAFGWRLAMGMAENVQKPKGKNNGIKPDVKISSKTADWVKFAEDYLN